MPRTWQMIATIALLFGINSRVLSTQAAEPETHSEAASTQAPPEATTNSHVPAAEVEAAINSLSQPIDNEQLSRIFQDLPQVADPKERERLQQLLDAKMQTTLEEPAARQEPLPDMAKIAAPSMEPPSPAAQQALRQRIDALTLGPSATTENLRQRDDVVSAIIGIQDPMTREELLHRLAEREAAAATTAQPPTATK